MLSYIKRHRPPQLPSPSSILSACTNNDPDEIQQQFLKVWSDLFYEAIFKDEFHYDENIPMKYPTTDQKC
jgi:penicillin amidase